jgi:putative ABC transport system ATP-binding protein
MIQVNYKCLYDSLYSSSKLENEVEKAVRDDQDTRITNGAISYVHENGVKSYSHKKESKGKDKDDYFTSPVALKMENVSKIFKSPAGELIALKKISFAVRRGEFVSIVGPSGSGKSTLLNIIGALDRPSDGRVFIDNVDIFSLKDSQIAQMRNSLIGYIFQSFNLINRTTVQKNVEIPAIISGMNSEERHRRSLKLLRILGIEDKAWLKPVNLSGGQQQRVAIARSLMNNPAIILADEPTGNLDSKTGEEVFDLLRMLANKFKRTIVFVTHNPELASRTDRTIFIRDGAIEKEIIN